MKIEYFFTGALALVIFGYVLDFLSGPIVLDLASPFAFLNPEMLAKYPFTAVSVGVKTLAIFIATVLAVTSLGGNNYPMQGATVLILAALMELYAIQQIATKSSILSIQWNLSLAFAGASLIIPAVIFVLTALIKSVHRNLTADPYDSEEDVTR